MAMQPHKTEDVASRQAAAQPAPDVSADGLAPGLKKGQRSKTPLTDVLDVRLDVREGDGQGTWKERLVGALLKEAVEGNLRAIQEIWTRLEGKAGAPATPDSAPLTVSDEVARAILRAGRKSADDADDDADDDEEERDDASDADN
jgi:hypothetical protein